MVNPPRNIALIVAGGRGIRAGGEIPKQYQLLGGAPVLAHTVKAFLSHRAIEAVFVVINEADRDSYAAVAAQHDRLMAAVVGGDRRQASVRLGLLALQHHAPER